MKKVTEQSKVYHAHPAMSKGKLFNMKRSPMFFKHAMDNPSEPTDNMVIGSAFHTYVLEHDEFEKEYAVIPKLDKRFKENKIKYAEFIEENVGKQLIDEETMAMIDGMKQAVLDHGLAKHLVKGDVEQSVYFTDELTGLDCKTRPDVSFERGGRKILVDLKSCTDASEMAFMRDAIKFGYDVQAYMYLLASQADDFIFVAVEKTEPYLINVFEATSDFLEFGKKRYIEYITRYKDCLSDDEWYGYNGREAQLTPLDIPAWARKEL